MSLIPSLLVICFLVVPAIALIHFAWEYPEKEEAYK